MNRAARLVPVGICALLLAACSVTHKPSPKPAATPNAAGTPSATGSPAAASPNATGAPNPAASPAPTFTGPGAFFLPWDFATFGTAACPTGHPGGTCYNGSANGQLPIIGHVDLTRYVYNDSSVTAPAGCLSVVTEGTLRRSDGGQISFHAPGRICGDLSTFTVDRSTGTGPLAGYKLEAYLKNGPGSEVWTGRITAP